MKTGNNGFGEKAPYRDKAKRETVREIKEKLRADQVDRAELETVAAGLFHLWYMLKPFENGSLSELRKTFFGGSVYNLRTEIARVINTIDLLISETNDYGALEKVKGLFDPRSKHLESPAKKQQGDR